MVDAIGSTDSSGSTLRHMREDICSGRGICPIDSLELDEQHLIDLPPTGTITNFVIVTLVQYRADRDRSVRPGFVLRQTAPT